jgi:DNA-binding NarL/FixJ family response regulator
MKILLLEDHPIVRLGVCQLITQHWPEAEIIEAETLAAGLLEVRRDGILAAVVDLNLPDAEGLESVSQLRRAAPNLRILVLSLNAETAYATRALQMGAAGYLNKDRAADELVIALERVMAGGRYITATLAERLAGLMLGESAKAPHDELSPQEHRVLLHLAEGKRLTEIGELMHLSPKTVTTYKTRIFEKLGVSSNAELIRYCISHGLITDNP